MEIESDSTFRYVTKNQGEKREIKKLKTRKRKIQIVGERETRGRITITPSGYTAVDAVDTEPDGKNVTSKNVGFPHKRRKL